MTQTDLEALQAGIALLPQMKDALGWAKSINAVGICSRKVEVGVEPFETLVKALEAAASPPIAGDRRAVLEDALKRIVSVVSYPVATEINPRGWGERRIDTSGSELIAEIAIRALASPAPVEAPEGFNEKHGRLMP